MTYILLFFFFTDTTTTEIYTLSLHDALPICYLTTGNGQYILDTNGKPIQLSSDQFTVSDTGHITGQNGEQAQLGIAFAAQDRKSTRLNSSHANISYAVFCLKKKKNKNKSP